MPMRSKTSLKRRTSGIDIAHGRIYSLAGEATTFTDPAEHLDFARPIAAPDAARFDNRSDEVLQEAAFSEASALERERALWELVDRQGEDAHPVVERFLDVESSRSCRIQALWLLQKTAGLGTPALMSKYFHDEDTDVADWARLLTEELTGDPVDRIYRKAKVLEGQTFDQTLPLLIAGHVLVTVPDLGRIQVTLSPLWFEQILGRVMACTNRSTFMTNLVIEKALEGLHSDGSTHYELFLFKGNSYQLAPTLYQHHYESVMTRAFYPSGTVEVGDAIPVAIPLARVAGTEVQAPQTSASSNLWIVGDGPCAQEAARSGFVRSVRGRYSGWAAVNLNTVLETNFVPPGSVQLSNPTHPLAGPMTNAVLFGTFRGKITDHDGDGLLDVNTIPCHGTVDAEHDLHCDGTRVPDPFERKTW
jgi:hypothetical protein